jgi:LAO/AO transport system kinase
MTPRVRTPSTIAALTERLLARDAGALARAITLVENETDEGAAIVAQVYARSGQAYLVGVTGSPGAGKSTLADRLIGEWRRAGLTVGVLAVDPTSPYTGGAILGDRVRMQAHAEDAGVFIRSMATRGHLGGLAQTTTEAATLLDAAGFDIVMIETVGVGQDEVDVVRTADISLVVVVPGSGDDVQALKAGIMEIADIFVVNKADRDGADRTAASIETMLSLEEWPAGEWRPPVVRTEATSGRGVPELVATIQRFRSETTATVGERRRVRAEWRLRELLGRLFMQHLERHVLAPGEFAAVLDRVAERETDPYTAAAAIVKTGTGVCSTDPAASEPGLPPTRPGSEGPGSVEHTPVPLTPLDHIGIAVHDPAELVAWFDQVFGVSTSKPEDVGLHRLRFVETGGATLELVQPLSPDAPVARFLAKHGPGLHHLCLRVRDIDAAVAALKARGIQLIDETPRAGAHGSRIAFIHPSSAHGLLVELKAIENPPAPFTNAPA